MDSKQQGPAVSKQIPMQRGLTMIDAGILGRIGRTVDDWSLTAADDRDAKIMRDLAEARYAKWCEFVGVPSSSNTGATK